MKARDAMYANEPTPLALDIRLMKYDQRTAVDDFFIGVGLCFDVVDASSPCLCTFRHFGSRGRAP